MISAIGCGENIYISISINYYWPNELQNFSIPDIGKKSNIMHSYQRVIKAVGKIIRTVLADIYNIYTSHCTDHTTSSAAGHRQLITCPQGEGQVNRGENHQNEEQFLPPSSQAAKSNPSACPPPVPLPSHPISLSSTTTYITTDSNSEQDSA